MTKSEKAGMIVGLVSAAGISVLFIADEQLALLAIAFIGIVVIAPLIAGCIIGYFLPIFSNGSRKKCPLDNQPPHRKGR